MLNLFWCCATEYACTLHISGAARSSIGDSTRSPARVRVSRQALIDGGWYVTEGLDQEGTRAWRKRSASGGRHRPRRTDQGRSRRRRGADPGAAHHAGRAGASRWRGVGPVPRAWLSRRVAGSRRHAVPDEPVSHDPRRRHRRTAARALGQQSARLQPAPGPTQADRGRQWPGRNFRPNGLREVDDARGADRGDQYLARAEHHHPREPTRIHFRKPALLHPPARDSDALPDVRASCDRRAAREP